MHMPSRAIRKQPVRKLRFLRTCRSTRPLGLVQECQIQPMSATTSAATAQRTQIAPNQSSSWPLSRTTCRQPVQTIEQAEADVVEGADLGVLDVGRVVDEAADHEYGQDADRNVDVEGIAPAEGIGQPAAQGGAEHRRDDDSQAIGGHGHGALGRRESFPAGWIATAAAARRRPRPAGRGPAE